MCPLKCINFDNDQNIFRFSIIKLVANSVTWLANGKIPVIATHTSDLVIVLDFPSILSLIA
jgi:hypothetical protein